MPSEHTSDQQLVESCLSPIVWIVLDLESTGLNLARDRITQVAAIAYLTSAGGGAVDTKSSAHHALCCGQFTCLVCPGAPVSAGAARVSGLNTANLAGQPSFAAQGARWLSWLGAIRAAFPDAKPILVAHNGIRFCFFCPSS